MCLHRGQRASLPGSSSLLLQGLQQLDGRQDKDSVLNMTRISFPLYSGLLLITFLFLYYVSGVFQWPDKIEVPLQPPPSLFSLGGATYFASPSSKVHNFYRALEGTIEMIICDSSSTSIDFPKSRQYQGLVLLSKSRTPRSLQNT